MLRTITALLAALALAAPAAAQQSFKVGVLTDMSGPVSTFSGTGSVTAAEMAIEDFGPTVLGRKIELVVADHQMKADVAAGIARQWYENDGVELILDVAVSSAALAVMEISATVKKPVLLSTAASSTINGKACTPMPRNGRSTPMPCRAVWCLPWRPKAQKPGSSSPATTPLVRIWKRTCAASSPSRAARWWAGPCTPSIHRISHPTC